MTPPDAAQQPTPPFSDVLVIIGAPVFGGRLPVDAIKRFKQLKANKTLAVLIVVYGNRDFKDACTACGTCAGDVQLQPFQLIGAWQLKRTMHSLLCVY